MRADKIAVLALALAALGLLMLAAVVIAPLVSARRGARALEWAFEQRAAVGAAKATAGVAAATPPAGASEPARPVAGSASRRADFADAMTTVRRPSAPNAA